MNDRFTVRSVVVMLGVVTVGGLVMMGALALQSLPIPQEFNSITSGALGGLTALLVSVRSHDESTEQIGDPDAHVDAIERVPGRKAR